MPKKTILIVSLFLSSQLFCPPEEANFEEPHRSDNHIDPVTKPRNWFQKIIDFLRKPKNPRNPSQKRDPKTSSSTNSQNLLLIHKTAQQENNSLSEEEKETLLKELSDQVFTHHSKQGEDSNNPKLTQEEITIRLQQEKELKAIVTTSEEVAQLFKDQPTMTDEVNELYEQFKQERLELVEKIIHEKPNDEELLTLKEAFDTALEKLLVKAFDPIENLKKALSKGDNGYKQQLRDQLLNYNFFQISDTSEETQNLYEKFTKAFNQAGDASTTATSALKTTEFFITLEKAKEALLKGIQKSGRSKTADKNWETLNKKLTTIKEKAEKLLSTYKKLTDQKGKAPDEYIKENLTKLIKLNANTLTREDITDLTDDLADGSFNKLITLLKAKINMLISKEKDQTISNEAKQANDQLESLIKSGLFDKKQIHIIMLEVEFNDPRDPIALTYKENAIKQTNELTPEQKSIINKWIYKEFIRSGMGLENHDQIKTDQINPDQIRDFVKDFSDGRVNVQKNTFLQIFKDITLINKACNANSIPFQISFIPKPTNESEAK